MSCLRISLLDTNFLKRLIRQVESLKAVPTLFVLSALIPIGLKITFQRSFPDGVAPRAKMNQQRSRRFRSAKEAKEAREKAIERGEQVESDGNSAFDSNCITPGTEFMAKLDAHMIAHIQEKVAEPNEQAPCYELAYGLSVPFSFSYGRKGPVDVSSSVIHFEYRIYLFLCLSAFLCFAMHK